MHQQQAAFENILLFPQCFVLIQIIVSPFVHIFDFIAAELKKPKTGIWGKGLRKTIKFVVLSKLKAFVDNGLEIKTWDSLAKGLRAE